VVPDDREAGDGSRGTEEWDLRQGELRWSDTLFRLFGLAPGEITPSTQYVFERVFEDDRDRVRQAVEAATVTGELGALEYRILREDGAIRRLHAIVSSTELEAGGTRHFQGTVQDVTDRRQIAREVGGHIALEEVLATWVSLEADAGRLLARLGDAKGFHVGALWLLREDALMAHSVWNASASAALRAPIALRTAAAPELEGLSAQAWRSRQPVVIVDLSEASPFAGRDAAICAGLRGAVAIPAVSEHDVLAVLEFFSRERLQETETSLRSLTGMGHELGHFFARRRGELRPPELTAREREILQLTAEGMSVKEVAQKLFLSPSTIKSHFENIYSKWAVSDRASAVAKAIREGLIR
jgi:two-component system nitrate/nitrite response regulator NarL